MRRNGNLGIKTIDAEMMRRMFMTGAKNLELNKEWINQLNVFPVPDGDTGTNMTLTIMSAASEVNALGDPVTIEDLSKAVSGGSLRGARGNSGVILSQLLRGFTKAIRDEKELDAVLIAKAMERGVETAYKAVMKPKEGTILTVARAVSEKAKELAETSEDLESYLRAVLEAGRETLERTPDMLPVLKEAGVVDSGGQGLICVLEGCLDALEGRELNLSFESPIPAREAEISVPQGQAISTDDIKFGYCTEFIINLDQPCSEEEEEKLKDYFLSLGDSLVLVADDDIIKIHVHTNHPGLAFEKGLEYGSLSRMKIDNMRIEHQEKLFRESEIQAAKNKDALKKTEQPRMKYGFITVTTGDGLSEIFRGLGVTSLIEGGQTMNPSTDDIIRSIREVHAENVFILPNNKNIILAANQACALAEDCRVFVVPTKTIPQGISAMISFLEEQSPEENFEAMSAAASTVKTVEITYAVRDTKIDGREIHNGDIMAISDQGIAAVGSDIKEVALEALTVLADDDTELISIYNGAEFDESEAGALLEEVSSKFPNCDVEANYGGQPIYYCILSIE